MDGYSYYWWIRDQFARCDLLSSSTEKEICKASVMAQVSRVGFTESVILAQALQRPQVIQAQTGALPIIAALVIGAMLLSSK